MRCSLVESSYQRPSSAVPDIHSAAGYSLFHSCLEILLLLKAVLEHLSLLGRSCAVVQHRLGVRKVDGSILAGRNTAAPADASRTIVSYVRRDPKSKTRNIYLVSQRVWRGSRPCPLLSTVVPKLILE